MSGEPLDKDELIRDLRRQLAAAQSELRLNKRRAETRGALIDRLREAPRKQATAPAEVTSKLGRPRGLWHSPVLLGVVVMVMLGFAQRWGDLWGWLALITCHLALDRLVVTKEEAYLSTRFGAAYEAYRTRVRRWV